MLGRMRTSSPHAQLPLLVATRIRAVRLWRNEAEGSEVATRTGVDPGLGLETEGESAGDVAENLAY